MNRTEILIICRDRYFARMLELELEGEGRSITVLHGDGEQSSLSPPGDIRRYSLAVLDLDVRPAIKLLHTLELNKIPSLLFGASDVSRYFSQGDISDSYYVKRFYRRPFSAGDFTADAEKLLKGLPNQPQPASGEKYSCADDFIINEKTHTVTFRGKLLMLSAREYSLLCCLLCHRGTPVTRRELFASLNSTGCDTSNIVDVYIRYLRRKIEDEYGVTLIKTCRFVGYMIP